MKFVKRFLPLMVVGILIFASCATNTGQVPKEAETPPVTQEAQPQEQPQQPSVEKYELQNLFQQANTLKAEATDFDLNSVDPDGFLAASNKHDAVAAQYQDLVETPAEYDGVKAYPLKQDLEDLVAAWTQVVEKGLPLRADAEKNAADETRAAAMNADAPSQAPAQYDAGLQYYSQASTEYDAANYKEAITSYQLAGAAFDSAAAAAEVNVLRADIEKNGYSGYESIQTYFSMGEDKYKEAQDLWQKNTLDDIKASTAAFKEAQSYYSFVETKGSELKAIEGKDKAVAAQEEALQVKADVNAPDDYQQAVDILAEADKNMQDGSYASAYSGYLDAVSAFEASRDVASAKEQEVTDAIAKAETGFAEAKDRASELGLEENIYLTAAAEHLDKAKALKEEVQYNDALFETNEVFNYIGLSDNFVQEETQTREKARLEQLEKDKADADAAIADAKTRIAWADEVDLKSDYPQEYTDASTSMSGAEIAYNNEKYAPATELANEVLSILSPDFEAKVAADRAEKAKQTSEAAIAENMKYAQTAIADAQSRYDWAASKNAANNYPELFKQGGDALADAKTAFNALDYTRAKDLAAQSYWALMQINEFAPLPATYVVRLIPQRRDCLWRIAEYAFIYNNPYKWPVLYQANKATFKDPSNPDLIFPGQVLKIPSIKGETRDGVWDPNKTYQPLAK